MLSSAWATAARSPLAPHGRRLGAAGGSDAASARPARSGAAALAALSAVSALATLAGCTASSDEVRPPSDEFFFPTGLALDPAQSTLFVTNANSELRYDSGVIHGVDLDVVDSVASAWTSTRQVPSGCRQDPTQPETLVCDESAFAFVKTAVRIGNFATGLSVQDLGGGAARLIVPVRGDPSVTWIEWNGSELSCEDGGTGFTQCDDRHRLTLLRNDEDLGGIPEEPFRSFADSPGQFALITHLNSGTVTLLDSQVGKDPEVADVLGGLFLSSSNSAAGSSAVAGRNPGSDDILYVASRSEDRIQMLTVDRPSPGARPQLVPTNFFFLDAAGGNNGGSSDSRGIAFAKNGDRALIINRRPPTLQIYDSSLDATGFPKNDTVAVYDICREASSIAVGDAGYGELALITCFRNGTMYIIDAEGRRTTDAILTVGAGPFDVALSSARRKAYVTNFLDDSVGVIELAPGSANQYREVLRIGETRL